MPRPEEPERLSAAWEFFTEDNFVNPIAAQYRAGPRSAAVFGQRGRKAQNPAASTIAHSVDSPPIFAIDRDAVVFGKRFIYEAVIGVEQRKHGAVVLKQIDEEEHGFFLHVGAQIREGWKMSFAFFIQGRQIPDMQPLRADSVANRRILGSLSMRRDCAASTSGFRNSPAAAEARSSASGVEDHKK